MSNKNKSSWRAVENRVAQWQPLIELVIVLSTIVGSTVPLYIHTDYKFHETMRAMDVKFQDGMRESREEMREQATRSDRLYEMFIALLEKNCEKGTK